MREEDSVDPSFHASMHPPIDLSTPNKVVRLTSSGATPRLHRPRGPPPALALRRVTAAEIFCELSRAAYCTTTR